MNLHQPIEVQTSDDGVVFFAWYKERKNCSETPLEYIIKFLVLILGENHSPLFRVFMTVYNGDGNSNIYCHFEFWF